MSDNGPYCVHEAGEGYALLQRVYADGKRCATIIRAGYAPEQTAFVTAPESCQQVGHVVYPAGGSVQRHYHKPATRTVVGMGEVLVVQRGECVVTFLDSDRRPMCFSLRAGDVLIIEPDTNGRSVIHGFDFHEDTVLLEIKQGPYMGDGEKVRL